MKGGYDPLHKGISEVCKRREKFPPRSGNQVLHEILGERSLCMREVRTPWEWPGWGSHTLHLLEEAVNKLQPFPIALPSTSASPRLSFLS